jgi:hypothetical protein
MVQRRVAVNYLSCDHRGALPMSGLGQLQTFDIIFQCYSDRMAAALMMGHHFAISAF